MRIIALLFFLLAACSDSSPKERVVINRQEYWLSAESVKTLRARDAYTWVRLNNYEDAGAAVILTEEAGHLTLLQTQAKILTLQAWAKTIQADKDIQDRRRESPGHK